MDLMKLYGCKVFGVEEMREYLPDDAFQSLKRTIDEGSALDPQIAQVVAQAMKDWAVRQGATHYTHWFQPMTNITAEKHDSFLTPDADGKVLLEFSSKALVKGEPDASSFPSGGLRATFEARGYTAWDPTSPAFVKDTTLYIPTAFCSYTGEALDQKTPLLRSMQALSREGLRFLRLLWIRRSSHQVYPTVGAEQEYFLVDREQYESRLDLKICGRTLLGARPPKGQELDDHYCGRIRIRVADFMRDLDEHLWELGIPSKTKHNEAAPAQHELAPVYEIANVACDHNHLIMETMRTVAKRHGLACLLHEKPFENINGSGKHNNYSICTDDGINFLSPGKTPQRNLLFLLTICAFIRGIDRYGDLLRLSCASAGNDRRLGAHEAPPSIISIFLGDELTRKLQAFGHGDGVDLRFGEKINTGVSTLPELEKDDSDRNRTSPFAFTFNKFEFRMVGSSQSIAMSNVVLNAIMCDSFSYFSDRLEKADDRQAEARQIIADMMERHSRIIYNGNNYSEQWHEEAKRRGLPILNSSVDAFDAYLDPKNIKLFGRFDIFSEVECRARHEVLFENYCKVVSIEAATMLEMVKRQVLPTAMRFLGEIATSLNQLTAAGIASRALPQNLSKLSNLLDRADEACVKLERSYAMAQVIEEIKTQALFIRDNVLPDMQALREVCDQIETMVDARQWPMPTYSDLLTKV